MESILKEIHTERDVDILFERKTHRHYIFKKPTDFYLTSSDHSTLRHYHNVLGGLNMYDHQDASLDYCSHAFILTSWRDYLIFTQGNITTNFISTILPCGDIWDIQDIS